MRYEGDAILPSQAHGGKLWRYRRRQSDGKLIPLGPASGAATTPAGSRPVVTDQTPQRTTTTPGRPPKPRGSRRDLLRDLVMQQTGTSKVTLPANLQAPPVDPLDAQVDAQVQLKYGAKQAELERNARAIPEWFKAYQAEITRASEANTAAQAQAMAQLGGLQSALTGLGTQQAQALGVSENQSAATRGATADAGMAQRAVDAGGARRDLLASFGAMLNQQGATQSGRDTEAARYAAGQQIAELQRNAEERQRLASEKGAFKVDTRRQLLDDLRRHTIEEAMFGAELAKDAAKRKADAAEDARRREDKANEVNEWGYTKAQWDQMTPEQRAKAIADFKRSTSPPPQPRDTGKINEYGYPDDVWRRMTTAQRQKIIAEAKAGRGSKPKVGKPTRGPGSLTTGEENRIWQRIDPRVSDLLGAKRKNGNLVISTPEGDVTIADSNGAIIRQLMSDFKLSRAEAHVIVSLYRNNGTMGPDGVRNAHSLGLHVGGRYKLVKKQGGGAMQGLGTSVSGDAGVG